MSGGVSIRALRRHLLKWFRANQRTMPWRQTSDPYAIWVSEIMLQQTQVATVIPYYERFLAAFPTVRALADAPIDRVLKLWEGLGYYTRARNLHRAAQVVTREYGGRLPSDAARLRALPGIGRYTAGAIASIAFGLDEPLLDGNVSRVLCRVFRVDGDPKAGAIASRLWDLARELIPPGRAGDFNQALMELGAIVCTPKKPVCFYCPLRRHCRAFRECVVERYPKVPRKKAVPHVDVAVGIVFKGGRVLIGRRPPEGMLGGMWELPGGKIEPGEQPEHCAAREIAEETGIAVEVGSKVAEVRHAYSHFKITLHAYRCQWLSGEARPIGCDEVKWVWPSQLARYAFPRATIKALDALNAT